MKYFAIILCLLATTSHVKAQSALSDVMCAEVAGRTNSRTPIRSGQNLVLQEAVCDQVQVTTRQTYRYVFEEMGHQAADSRAGKRLGLGFQKRFCDQGDDLYNVIKLMNVRVTLEDATGGPMGSHEFGLSDC